MYLVFDVGGSAIKYALMKKHGDIAKKGSEPTHLDIPNGLEVFVKSIVDIYESFKGRETIDGIAMDLPGQIDVDNGIVYGGGALQFLDKVPLGKIISEKCDGINVALENDGKCAALAEAWQGNGKSYDNVFVMVFGTGVGGGLVVNQRVLRGANLSAGEISYFIEGMNMDHLETAFNYMENADRMPLDEFMKKMLSRIEEEGTRQKRSRWYQTLQVGRRGRSGDHRSYGGLVFPDSQAMLHYPGHVRSGSDTCGWRYQRTATFCRGY